MRRRSVATVLFVKGVFVCDALGTSAGYHGIWGFTIAVRIVKSLRTQAVSATFAALPRARSCAYNPLRIGWYPTATSVLIDQVARTWVRPPQTVQVPRKVPRSRCKDATPTRAAMRWRLKGPNAGRS